MNVLDDNKSVEDYAEFEYIFKNGNIHIVLCDTLYWSVDIIIWHWCNSTTLVPHNMVMKIKTFLLHLYKNWMEENWAWACSSCLGDKGGFTIWSRTLHCDELYHITLCCMWAGKTHLIAPQGRSTCEFTWVLFECHLGYPTIIAAACDTHVSYCMCANNLECRFQGVRIWSRFWKVCLACGEWTQSHTGVK